MSSKFHLFSKAFHSSDLNTNLFFPFNFASPSMVRGQLTFEQSSLLAYKEKLAETQKQKSESYQDHERPVDDVEITESKSLANVDNNEAKFNAAFSGMEGTYQNVSSWDFIKGQKIDAGEKLYIDIDDQYLDDINFLVVMQDNTNSRTFTADEIRQSNKLEYTLHQADSLYVYMYVSIKDDTINEGTETIKIKAKLADDKAWIESEAAEIKDDDTPFPTRPPYIEMDTAQLFENDEITGYENLPVSFTAVANGMEGGDKKPIGWDFVKDHKIQEGEKFYIEIDDKYLDDITAISFMQDGKNGNVFTANKVRELGRIEITLHEADSLNVFLFVGIKDDQLVEGTETIKIKAKLANDILWTESEVAQIKDNDVSLNTSDIFTSNNLAQTIVSASGLHLESSSDGEETYQSEENPNASADDEAIFTIDEFSVSFVAVTESVPMENDAQGIATVDIPLPDITTTVEVQEESYFADPVIFDDDALDLIAVEHIVITTQTQVPVNSETSSQFSLQFEPLTQVQLKMLNNQTNESTSDPIQHDHETGETASTLNDSDEFRFVVADDWF